MTSSIELKLLGKFSLTGEEGETIRLSSGKARALTAYLALNPDQHHSRAKLATLLWSRHDDEHARNNLSQCLHLLRRVLAPHARRIIQADKDGVTLNASEIVVDVLDLRRLAADGSPAALAEAAALSVDGLLSEFEINEEVFADWLAREREVVSKTATDVLTRLAETQLEAGEAEAAVTTATRVVAEDPLNEVAHRMLMRAYVSAGRRHAALQQYQSCAETLRRELGVEPETATKTLFEELRRCDPGASKPARPGSKAGTSDKQGTGDGQYPRLPDKPSIAVLPFANLSDDSEQEYFADGIAEDIITALSRFHSLFVIARNSSFTFKGRAVDITRVARDLGVRYVVEGSVRKAGNRLRISAQLIDASNGTHLWADRFDGAREDVFDLQDEITEQVIVAVAPEVEAHERDRARRKAPERLDAWELYQRGLWHFYKFTKEDFNEARNLFSEAIGRDPDFSLPHAGIAYVCLLTVIQGFDDDREHRQTEGLTAGSRAVALDDKDGFAHMAFGRLLAFVGENERAIAELERSVSLNPSYAHGYYGLGAALNWCGRATDAIPVLDMAMRLSPQDPMLWAMQTHRATSCLILETFDEAEEWARKAVNGRPDLFQPQAVFVSALVGQGRLDEAHLALEGLRRARPEFSLSVLRRLLSHTDPDYRERRIELLRKAGLPE